MIALKQHGKQTIIEKSYFITLGGLPPGLQPIHKSSIVMFLERVYGIDDQSTFFRLLEDCFLADLRAATTLDMVSFYAIQMSSGMRFPTIWHFDKCRLR